MMAAPLLVSTDLTKLSSDQLALLTNPSLVAIDQDPIGAQGRVFDRQGEVLVMLKPLKGNGWALLAANLGDKEAAYQVPVSPLTTATSPVLAKATDVFADEALTDISVLEGELRPHDSALFVLDPG
jgi:alpha-galactosidase